MEHKIYTYQFIRAIACLVVLTGHLFVPRSVYVTIANITSIEYATVGIGMFLFISGYLCSISIARDGPIVFLLHRVFRIYPVFLLLCIIAWATSSYEHANIHNMGFFKLLKSQLFFKITLLTGDWTLPLEFLFYIFLASCFILARKNFKIIPYIIILAVVIYFLLSKDSRFLNRSTGFVLLMLSGVFFYRSNQINLPRSMYYKLCISIVLGICFYNAFDFSSINVPFRHYSFSLSFIESTSLSFGVLVAFMLTKVKLKERRFFNFIANISYPLYLIHASFPNVKSFIITEYFPKFINHSNTISQLVFLIIITIPFSYLLHRYFEKPIIKYSRPLISKLLKLEKNNETPR